MRKLILCGAVMVLVAAAGTAQGENREKKTDRLKPAAQSQPVSSDRRKNLGAIIGGTQEQMKVKPTPTLTPWDTPVPTPTRP